MANYVQVPPDSTGRKIDAVSLDVGVESVVRQRIVLADNSATAQFATITGGALVVTGMVNISSMPALTAAISGAVDISTMPAVVLAAGAANIGSINNVSRTVQIAVATPFTVNNISATVTTSGLVGLTAGTANIGHLNHISATVSVAGVVGLTAGTANIGFLDSISRTVQVAIATPFTINNISATVNVAGTFSITTIDAISATVQVAIATPFTINDISRTVQVAISTPFTVNNVSATVTVAGVVGIIAGTSNIGRINDISATVTVAGIVNISATHSVILAAGTALIGDINAISRTVQVAIGTPFTINNISASVTVTGLVGLTAGAANIGFINHISRTIEVAIATPFTINNISATVLASITNTVTVAGQLSAVLATGSNNIGVINHISRTSIVAISTPFTLNNISASVLVATGATADFNTLASADQVQTLPLFGFALPADGGAVAGGTSTNPLHVVVENASATVSVVLASGTSNFGTLNDISRTVQVAIATPFTLNNISATVQVAIGTPFTINNVSATVTVALTTFAPVFRQVVGARTSLTATGLPTLAAATYLVTDVYTCNTNKPTDVIIELGVGTTNTPAGNFRIVAYLQESLNGTNFRSGPTSGTTTTDEPDLKPLGVVPLNTSSTGANHIGFFSLFNTCGFMPHSFRLVIKNDTGVALTTATLVTSEITTVAS